MAETNTLSVGNNINADADVAARVTHIVKRATTMRRAKEEYSKNWGLYEKYWKFFEEIKTGKNKWRATLPDSFAYATVKTAQSAFLDSDVMPVFSRREDEDTTKANDLRDLFSFIAEKGDLKKELYYARLDAFKLGTGFLRAVYLKDEREIYKIDKYDPETDEITYKKEKVRDFDDPKVTRISPYLMLVDEMAKADFETARDCIEVEILGYDDAKRIYGHLVKNWDEKIPKYGQLSQVAPEVEGRLASAVAVPASGPSPLRDGSMHADFLRIFAPFDMAESTAAILHYWNKIEDSYEIVINGQGVKVMTPGKPSPNPYIHKRLPYIPIQFSPYSGDEFWAAGIIEVIRWEVYAHQIYREMMTDRQKVSLFSPAFGDVSDEIDQSFAELEPFTVYRTRGGQIKQYQIPGITNADLALKKDFEDAIKRASGIDERLLGFVGGKSRMTATEVSFIREASLARLREFLFLYKQSLIRMVRITVKLFEQYYSSPIKSEPMIKGDEAVKSLKVLMKKFKIKTGNVYRSKEVYEGMFAGDIEDVELDMQVLVPMTPAQLITKWAQVIRDLTPFIQAGAVNIDLDKIIGKYLESMDVNIETLRKDIEGYAVRLADAEHELLRNANTSSKLLLALPNGTPDTYLTEAHIRRHKELADRDDAIEDAERNNMAKHIAQDVTNWFKKLSEAKNAQPNLSQMNNGTLNQFGGVAPHIPVDMGGGQSSEPAPSVENPPLNVNAAQGAY